MMAIASFFITFLLSIPPGHPTCGRCFLIRLSEGRVYHAWPISRGLCRRHEKGFYLLLVYTFLRLLRLDLRFCPEPGICHNILDELLEFLTTDCNRQSGIRADERLIQFSFHNLSHFDVQLHAFPLWCTHKDCVLP